MVQSCSHFGGDWGISRQGGLGAGLLGDAYVALG